MQKSADFFFGIAIHLRNTFLANIKHFFPLKTEENYKIVKVYECNKMNGLGGRTTP